MSGNGPNQETGRNPSDGLGPRVPYRAVPCGVSISPMAVIEDRKLADLN